MSDPSSFRNREVKTLNVHPDNTATMRTAVIYHSESGNTRAVAEYLAGHTGADLFRVQSKFPYNHVTLVAVGVRRAVCGTNDPVEPPHIDVGSYDCIVIGSPVWAGHPTPVINAAVAGLENCRGKEAVIYMTCSLLSRDAAAILADRVRAKGMKLKGSIVFHASELTDYRALERLVSITASPGYGTIRVD
jgi:flavodoxin